MFTRVLSFLLVAAGIVVGLASFVVLAAAKGAMHELFVAILWLIAVVLFVSGVAIDGLAGIAGQLRTINAQLLSGGGRRDDPRPPKVDPQYFYGMNDKEFGPLAAEAIRRLRAIGQIDNGTPVYKSGSGEWRTLADFPELR